VISDAVDGSPGNYSAAAPLLFKAYYPQFNPDDFELIEILTAIGVAVAAVMTLTGSLVATAGGVLFAEP
jgi:energy-converting hydrogenase Eha subunit F